MMAETAHGFTFGPMTVERTASGPKLGYVVTVSLPDGERVEIRSSPKGHSRLSVRHVVFSSEAE